MAHYLFSLTMKEDSKAQARRRRAGAECAASTLRHEAESSESHHPIYGVLIYFFDGEGGLEGAGATAPSRGY